MGLAGVAAASGSDATYWNPAILAQRPSTELQFLGYNAFETNYMSLQGSMSWRNRPIGISYINATVDDIPRNVDINGRGSTVGSEEYTATGAGADLGIHHQVNARLQLAANVHNLIKPKMQWDTPSDNVDTVPLTTRVGASYQVTSKLLTTGDLAMRDNRDARLYLGAEYQLWPGVILRGGSADD